MLKHISSVFWIVIAITAAAVLWGVISPDSLQMCLNRHKHLLPIHLVGIIF